MSTIIEENKICAHFLAARHGPGQSDGVAGGCGGCETQNLSYVRQLEEKDALVRKIVSPFAPKDFRPILPSPDAFYYRNKVEFAFASLPEGKVAIGLRQKNKFDQIVDLKE